ncbi:MAG: 1-phosphofructokinase [Bilifractor sp.]|jgi:tagatose 6-phosphate kinase
MITTVTLNASIDKAYHMNEAIENGRVMRVAYCSNTAGGKGLNVARVVALCGSDVRATGLVGGYNGSYLESLLDADGIRHGFGHVKSETRSCINILDPKYGSTEYLEPGRKIEAEEMRNFLDRVFPEQIEESDVVVFSGSAPEGAGKDIYARLIEKARGNGRKVILDTSGDLLIEGMKAGPDLVKPNQEELGALFHVTIESEEEIIRYGEKLHRTGIPFVVISLGGNGAVMICEKGVFHAKSPKIQVVNTVGCGDSMVGAFAVAFERNMDPQEALKFAVSVGSANAMSPDTGNFDPEVQKKLFSETTVERI